jgi:hypothetical protein
MKKSIASTGRAAFVGLLLTVGVYGTLDTVLSHDASAATVADCGDADNPCQLPALHVTAVRQVANAAGQDQARAVAEQAAPAPTVQLAES